MAPCIQAERKAVPKVQRAWTSQMELEWWNEEKERAKMEKRRLAWRKPTRGAVT